MWEALVKNTAEPTIPERIDELVRTHGSVNQVAMAISMSPNTLSRMRAGNSMQITPQMLHKLGLRANPRYQRIP